LVSPLADIDTYEYASSGSCEQSRIFRGRSRNFKRGVQWNFLQKGAGGSNHLLGAICIEKKGGGPPGSAPGIEMFRIKVLFGAW
jgi:hypothetical protein